MSNQPLEPWRDDMADGCTVVDDPPEFEEACRKHDQDYYERKIPQWMADWSFYAAMVIAAEKVKDVTRRALLMAKAKTRYFGVKLLGWLFYYT